MMNPFKRKTQEQLVEGWRHLDHCRIHLNEVVKELNEGMKKIDEAVLAMVNTKRENDK